MGDLHLARDEEHTGTQLEDVEEVALETSTQVYTSEQQAFELTAYNGGQDGDDRVVMEELASGKSDAHSIKGETQDCTPEDEATEHHQIRAKHTKLSLDLASPDEIWDAYDHDTGKLDMTDGLVCKRVSMA